MHPSTDDTDRDTEDGTVSLFQETVDAVTWVYTLARQHGWRLALTHLAFDLDFLQACIT